MSLERYGTGLKPKVAPHREMGDMADVIHTATRFMEAFDAPFDDQWDKRFDSALSNMRVAVRIFKRKEELRKNG